MSDYECIHCGHIDYRENHWKTCENHPANKVLGEAFKAIKDILDIAEHYVEISSNSPTAEQKAGHLMACRIRDAIKEVIKENDTTRRKIKSLKRD